MKYPTFIVASGEMMASMEAKLADLKAEFPAIKARLVADACRYGSNNRSHDVRREAAYQHARNLSDAITELDNQIKELRAMLAECPALALQAVTLPDYGPPADGFVYFAVRHADRAIKIGYSKNPSERVKGFSAGSGPCTLVAEKPGRMDDETELHRRFKDSRIGGEWFKPTEELLALIRKWPLL